MSCCIFNIFCCAGSKIKSNFLDQKSSSQERAQIINNLVSKKRPTFGLKLFNLLEQDHFKRDLFISLDTQSKNKLYEKTNELGKESILELLDEDNRSEFIKNYPYHLNVRPLFLSMLTVADSNRRSLDCAEGEVGYF
jgi:hypothetical protein